MHYVLTPTHTHVYFSLSHVYIYVFTHSHTRTGAAIYFTIGQAVLKGVYILYGSWLAFEVRKVPSMFNESASNGLALYSIGFMSAIALAQHYALSSALSLSTQVIVCVSR